MSNLINTYPVFESSQVLTSSQLNQVVSYLDQQGRLTRTKLIGMGIVCGLKLSYDDSGPETQVIISKGIAITSEGFLVSLGDCTTSWYRPYSLPEGVQYRPFGNPDQDVDLYELLKEMPEDDTDVLPLDNPGDFLDDKFVLLFLETFDNDLKSCLGNACDELGIDRIFTVRKLLISKDDLDLVLTRSANVGNIYPGKFELPDIVMPRTLFDPDSAHSQDLTAFSELYVDAFINSAYPALFGDESTAGALADTYSVYELLLGPVYGFNNPFESSVIDNLNNIFDDFTGSEPDFRGIQYFYDFLKDMILAYDEFRETAFDLMSECCPDMSRFPKHIMLGRAVVPNETPEEKSEYRHGFIQPPIYNHQKYLMDKVVSLHKRLVLMTMTFNPERFRYSDSDGEEAPPLRITPSDEKVRPLSKRSVPYYYDSKLEIPVVGDESLEQHWNFDFTRKKQPGTTILTLSYENQSDDQTSIISPLETPLYYDLDRFPFLRIEGHLGRPFEDAIDIINSIKSTFDLPFDAVALQLDPDAGLLELDYSCGFEDLQEEYTMARNTYCGFINDLMNLFSYIRENEDTIFNGDDNTSRDLEMVNEILESLRHLCELMTNCLDEFEFEAFQESYKIALQLILDFLLVEKRLLDEINIDPEDSDEQIPVINGMIQRVSPAAFRIIDLLFYNTFLRVYYAFKRREHYLQQETGVFSGYIRRHNGVDHQAGVHKGGTFILVYSNSTDREVIADFSLPYLCCSTEHCVPMCDEDDSTFVFNVPPFARPDYAVTTIGRSVEIDVSLNDFGFWNGGFSVETENETENGGIIEQLTEEGRLRYVPNEEFTGYDKFQYRIINSITGTQDTGTVTVLVKGRTAVGCYSADILSCWAAGDINMLVEIYNRRHPNSPIPGDSEDEVVEALLQSLRETRGFTLDEIRFNALESEERRRRLLTCIGIPHDENTSYQELERLILDYQNENCGEIVEEPALCYSHEILECWGIQSVQFALRIREIDASDMSSEQMIDTLLESLRETGGFTQNEIRFNVLESEQSRRQLLTCLGINHTPDTTYPELEQLILEYQNEHCGGEIATPRIELTVNEISGNDLRAVLSSRGREVSEDMTVSDLETEIRGTAEGMSFTPDEVMLLTRDRITQLLRNRNLSAPSSANKSELIEILFSQS